MASLGQKCSQISSGSSRAALFNTRLSGGAFWLTRAFMDCTRACSCAALRSAACCFFFSSGPDLACRRSCRMKSMSSSPPCFSTATSSTWRTSSRRILAPPLNWGLSRSNVPKPRRSPSVRAYFCFALPFEMSCSWEREQSKQICTPKARFHSLSQEMLPQCSHRPPLPVPPPLPMRPLSSPPPLPLAAGNSSGPSIHMWSCVPAVTAAILLLARWCWSLLTL
mmetsp:Transcript_14824/g.44779  ORF Transcript_14824/g.44779 Transcript_14824/m.44779 type:complete len:223 (-) Transcript_14824:898-1566(-)